MENSGRVDRTTHMAVCPVGESSRIHFDELGYLNKNWTNDNCWIFGWAIVSLKGIG